MHIEIVWNSRELPAWPSLTMLWPWPLRNAPNAITFFFPSSLFFFYFLLAMKGVRWCSAFREHGWDMHSLYTLARKYLSHSMSETWRWERNVAGGLWPLWSADTGVRTPSQAKNTSHASQTGAPIWEISKASQPLPVPQTFPPFFLHPSSEIRLCHRVGILHPYWMQICFSPITIIKGWMEMSRICCIRLTEGIFFGLSSQITIYM